MRQTPPPINPPRVAVTSGFGSETAIERIQIDAYLLVKLHVGGFELLLAISSGVLVLHLGQRHALGVLRWLEVADWGRGHGVERHIGVLGVSNLIEFYV